MNYHPPHPSEGITEPEVRLSSVHDTTESFSPLRPQSRARKPRRWATEQVRLSLYALSMGLDLVAVVAGYFVASQIGNPPWASVSELPILLISVSLFVMFSIGREAQSIETLSDPQLSIVRALYALAAAFLAEVMLFFVTQAGESVSRLGFTVFFVAAASFLIASRLIQHAATLYFLGRSPTSTILLLDGQHVEPEPGMTVIDVASRQLRPDLHEPALINALSNAIEGYDRVIVACPEDQYAPWSVFLQGADLAGEIVVGSERLRGAIGIGHCGSLETVVISRGPLSIGNRIKKRTFDLFVASALLLFLAPLLIVVAALIKLDSPGPVFFRQQRVGKGNRYFEIIKFRSMHAERTDPAGELSTQRTDPRVTRIGALIRRTSIDELPQLLNVVRGDMSLVGPRPHALGSLAGSQLFWEVDDRYWRRHSLRPGITGLAQVRGFRGSTDEVSDLENRLLSDLEYVANWSMALDVRIMFATLGVIVHDKAY